MGDKPLRDLISRLYHLSNFKLHFVKDVLHSQDQLSSLSLISSRSLTNR